MKIILPAIFLCFVTAEARTRSERDTLPQEIYRDDVEPAKGGKVPEAAHLRVELKIDMIDSAGLRDPEGIRMEQMMAAESPELLDHMLQDTNSKYNPGLTPVLKLKPGYAPLQAFSPAFGAAPTYSPVPAYTAAPSYGQPKHAYTPEPTYSPIPYSLPAPQEPVLLEKRPYEVKSVQSLPISVTETYTNFDCRSKPYAGRHYADVEAACEIYHFCHEDGKQDTFQCGYGTVFNEYIGTCDFKNSVQCSSGEGYAPAPYNKPDPYVTSAPYAAPTPYVAPVPVPYAAPFSYAAPASYSAPALYAAPASYAAPAPYAAPASYAVPATYHQPTVYHEPAPYHQPSTYHTAGPPLKPFTNF